MKLERKGLILYGRGYGSRFAPTEDNTWEAGPAAAPELYSDCKACRKVLKHRQLEMSQFRTVYRSTLRGSLGKKMGKPLGKPVQTSDNWPQCFSADFTHLMYMSTSLRYDGKPCRSPRRDGGSR
jgi:hypothetical protein